MPLALNRPPVTPQGPKQNHPACLIEIRSPGRPRSQELAAVPLQVLLFPGSRHQGMPPGLPQYPATLDVRLAKVADSISQSFLLLLRPAPQRKPPPRERPHAALQIRFPSATLQVQERLAKPLPT